MIEDYTKKGVAFAEVHARKHLAEQGAKLDPASKKAEAMKLVLDELKKHGITNVAEDIIHKRIEAFLEDNGHEPEKGAEVK